MPIHNLAQCCLCCFISLLHCSFLRWCIVKIEVCRYTPCSPPISFCFQLTFQCTSILLHEDIIKEHTHTRVRTNAHKTARKEKVDIGQALVLCLSFSYVSCLSFFFFPPHSLIMSNIQQLDPLKVLLSCISARNEFPGKSVLPLVHLKSFVLVHLCSVVWNASPQLAQTCTLLCRASVVKVFADVMGMCAPIFGYCPTSSLCALILGHDISIDLYTDSQINQCAH